MQQFAFIYSNAPMWRASRHLTFWFSWFLFQILIYSFSPSPALQNQSFSHRILITLPETLMYLLPCFFLAYTLMYLVIPRFVVPGKYIVAALLSILFVMLTAVLSALLSVSVIDAIRHWFADPIATVIASEKHPPLYMQLGVAMLAGLRGSITVGGVAAAIKLIKCLSERQQAALLLEKEKAKAELQMLKAQLHPHFLFNTLNNIYSYTQNGSQKASGMVMGLSKLLRYILYECNKPLVLLEDELKMIHEYIALERTRYDNQLEILVNMQPAQGNFLIAPLILLPFVENAFKHGASRMIECPWISLTIEMNDNQLLLKLINGKPAHDSEPTPGIGIMNVRRRLEMIYPNGYELQIDNEREMYIVNLRLTLLPVGNPSSNITAYDVT